jgi:serine/threonine-protein kinase
VGVLLYEMTTGVRPITGDGTYAVMNGHLHTIPRAPSAVNARVPEPLSLAILRAIEKGRDNRFQSARAFADSLMAVRSRLVQGSTPPWPVQDLQQTELAAPPVRTPTPPVVTTPSGTGQTGVRFDPERLANLTSELAVFVGPMAKVLVSRAAKKAQTWRQLYDALAEEVPAGAERKQFLSKRP